jgi:hypothetical protein
MVPKNRPIKNKIKANDAWKLAIWVSDIFDVI